MNSAGWHAGKPGQFGVVAGQGRIADQDLEDPGGLETQSGVLRGGGWSWPGHAARQSPLAPARPRRQLLAILTVRRRAHSRSRRHSRCAKRDTSRGIAPGAGG